MDPYFSAIVSNLWEIEAIEAIKAVSTAPVADTATTVTTLAAANVVLGTVQKPRESLRTKEVPENQGSLRGP